MTKILKSQPWSGSVNSSGMCFFPYTLDALNSLLAKVLYHSRDSRTLEFSDLFIAFHVDHGGPTSPLFFSRDADADADAELLCLAYALAQLPAGAFHAISLCFPHYNLVHAKPLNDLLATLVQIQCKNLNVSCITGEHHIDVLMSPVDTPMAWNLTNLTIEGDLNNSPFRPLLFGVSQSLEELTLCSYQATSTDFLWRTLLKMIAFPKLRSFQTIEDMPLPLLLDFLSQHPKVSILAITVHTHSKTTRMDDIIEKIDLKSLTVFLVHHRIFLMSCALRLLPHPWPGYPYYSVLYSPPHCPAGLRRTPVTVRWSPLSPVKVRRSPVEVRRSPVKVR